MSWIDWYDSLANMQRSTSSPLRRYGIGALAVAVATGLRLLLDPILEDKFPFVTLLLAVMVAAWYGGFGPALTATVVGALASAFAFLPPRGSFAVHGQPCEGVLRLRIVGV